VVGGVIGSRPGLDALPESSVKPESDWWLACADSLLFDLPRPEVKLELLGRPLPRFGDNVDCEKSMVAVGGER
jgi:hypothetical protein